MTSKLAYEFEIRAFDRSSEFRDSANVAMHLPRLNKRKLATKALRQENAAKKIKAKLSIREWKLRAAESQERMYLYIHTYIYIYIYICI
jgi:hypothetical protein